MQNLRDKRERESNAVLRELEERDERERKRSSGQAAVSLSCTVGRRDLRLLAVVQVQETSTPGGGRPHDELVGD